MIKHNVTVEDSSPLISYGGHWLDSPHTAPDYTKYSGYATPDFNPCHKTNSTDTFDFVFNGTTVYVYGTTSPIGNVFSLTLNTSDGSFTTNYTGNSHSIDTTYQALLYSYTGLNPTLQHTLHLANGGQGQFVLDYIVVENETGSEDATIREVVIDDADSAFTFSNGTWDINGYEDDTTGALTKYMENKTSHHSTEVGDKLQLEFRGSGIELHGFWYYGGFLATIDSYPPQLIQNPANITPGLYLRPRELLFAADGLEEADHVLTMKNMGAKAETWDTLSIDYAIISTIDPDNLNGYATGQPPFDISVRPTGSFGASGSEPVKTQQAVNADLSIGSPAITQLLSVVLVLWTLLRLRVF